MRKKIIIISGLVISLTVSVFVLLAFANAGFREKQIKIDRDYNELFTKTELQNNGYDTPIAEYTTDNSIGYKNSDGTKSLYVYSSPIHFKGENGIWKMIDTRITNVTDDELRERGYVYGVVANDIQSYFSNKLSKESGFLLKKNTVFEFGIRNEKSINPQYREIRNFIGDNKNMLIYKNIEAGTDIQLYPSSIGVNCEVVFNKKPKHNSLNFWIKVDNSKIVLKKQEGCYINIVEEIAQPNGDIKDTILGVIQVPLLKNKDGNISYNNNLISRPLGDNIYEIVFTFDSRFLDKGATAFIAFEMRREKQPDNAIYSQRPELVNVYLKNYSVIGNSPDYGIGQLLIRYQFVNKFSLKQDMIEKVNYYSYSLTTTNDLLEMRSMLEDWCSLTGTWNNHYKTGVGTTSIELSENEIKFDITDEVKQWCDNQNGKKEEFGLKMKSVNEKEGVFNVILSNDNSLYKNRTEIIVK